MRKNPFCKRTQRRNINYVFGIYQLGIWFWTIWYLGFIISVFAIYQFGPPSLPWVGISLLWKSSKKDDQFGESSKINCFPGFPRFFGQVLFRYQGNSPPSSKIHHKPQSFLNIWTFLDETLNRNNLKITLGVFLAQLHFHTPNILGIWTKLGFSFEISTDPNYCHWFGRFWLSPDFRPHGNSGSSEIGVKTEKIENKNKN